MKDKKRIAEEMWESGSYWRLSRTNFKGLVDGVYNYQSHDLYKTGEAAPDGVLDRNGEVVLALCKKCGLAENELTEFCKGEDRQISTQGVI